MTLRKNRESGVLETRRKHVTVKSTRCFGPASESLSQAVMWLAGRPRPVPLYDMEGVIYSPQFFGLGER